NRCFETQAIPTIYLDQTSKKFAHQYASIKKSDAISLYNNQIEVISFCNEDKNLATNQDQAITSSNTQIFIKLLPLSRNPNILSSNIKILSPDPNTSNLDILSLLPIQILNLHLLNQKLKKQKTTALSDDTAIYLGKGKTRKQVCNKSQNLIKKYMSKSANKTGKGASTWSFYTEMNDIFRNHENVNPDYLINSMGQIYGTSLEEKSNESKNNSLKSNKKQCLNEDESII
ncbi:41375_t:CDS:2, partial [Gigaspora margarita]